MEQIQKTIDVRCPLRAVYDQWTRFEDFPEFMSGVMEVQQIDDTHVHCHAEIGGVDSKLDAEIVEHVPNEFIAWRSVSGIPSAGIVQFEPLGPQLTRVQLVIAYEPMGTDDDARNEFEALNDRVQDTVEDFKWFIESRDGTTAERPRTDVSSGDSNAGAVAGDWPYRSDVKKE
jgi:uncharacterized membrane protein